jgi:hypothetical protein
MRQLALKLRSILLVSAPCVAAAIACGSNGATGDRDGGLGGGILLPDGGILLPDGAVVGSSSSGGGFYPDGGPILGSSSGSSSSSGSGSEDGSAGCQGCSCSPIGSTTSCWTGPPADRGVGDCKDGVATCEGTEFGSWGACVGEVLDCGDAAPPPPPPPEAGPPDASLPPESCIAGASFGILTNGASVTAYVPNASWSGTTTGVIVAQLEGTGLSAPVTIPTTQAVSSCSSDSTLNQVVCIGNNLSAVGSDVYVISGATNAISKTLSSAATTSQSFSGGDCDTCAQAVDPVHHTAFVSIGMTGGAAFQPLDLTTGTLGTPIAAAGQLATSENILVDPSRNLLLSPNEGEETGSGGVGDYQLLNISTGKVFDFKSPDAGATPGGEFDSAGEDCTTGIALATLEGTGELFLVDLTQATFSGTNWSAPYNFQNLPDFADFGAGTCGIAVATNSHLGVVTGEFGSNLFGAIQLPATSGKGAPALVDWVAAAVPTDPSGAAFNDGYDPHTVTTYTSPTTGKQYAVMADYGADEAPTYLAIVDLQALLALPRASAGAHTLATPLAVGSVLRFVKL